MNSIGVIVFLFGLVAVLLGSNLAVKGLKKLSEVTQISTVFVGFTIASIGTSLPEIFTNISASITGLPQIGVGNIMGSNISQISLILGVAGLITAFYMKRETLRREGLFILLAIIILTLTMLDFQISRWEAIMLIFIYVLFIGYIMWDDNVFSKERPKEKKQKNIKISISVLQIIFGFLFLIGGSYFLVQGAEKVAVVLGLSNLLVGILIVGVGTSLPELILAIQSVLKGSRGIALGTMVGSNITNPLLAMGLGGLYKGYVIDKGILFFDVPVWTLCTLVALYFLYSARPKEGKKLARRPNLKFALILIGIYLVYVILRLWLFKVGYFQ